MRKYRSRQKTLSLLGIAMLALIAVCLAVPTFGASLLLAASAVAPKLFLGGFALVHKGVVALAVPMFGCILRDKAGADGNGTFEDKVLKGVDSLVAENKEIRSDIQKVTADLDRADKEVKAALEDLTKVKNQTNARWEEINKKMEKVQKQIALNARSSFRDPVQRALANEEFRFYLNAVARYIAHCTPFAGDSLHKIDPAYKKAIEDGSIAAKALTGVDAGMGQATVPTDTFNEIYDLLLEYGDFATLGVQRVGARTNVIPLATARPQFYWIGSQSTLAEGSVITSGAFSGGQVLGIINTLAVLMYVSRELLADSTVDLAPYTIRQMIQSCNWGLDTAAFIGTGNQDTTNAGYVGIFNAASANSNLASVGAPGHTQTALLSLNDFVQTILTVSAQVLNRKPKWWVHPQMLARIALITDKNGRPLFQTWLEVPNPNAIGSILGYPVHPTAIAPSTDAASQPIIAFGDPMGQAVLIRSDLELATSADIGFPQNLMAYRTLLRAGVKLLTQASSTTLKPFAVLQTAAS